MSTLEDRAHHFAVRHWLKTAYGLSEETFDELSKDRGDWVAAALAFYTLLSMAPLIIIASLTAPVARRPRTRRPFRAGSVLWKKGSAPPRAPR
jgi:uncharacterized BrkB/YihY/UPF0761 family membrane protein